MSEVGDNTRNPVGASSTASIITHWIANTDGSVVPLGAPLGIDGHLQFDGFLSARSGIAATARAEATLTLQTDAGPADVYHSLVELVDGRTSSSEASATG